MTNDPVLCDYTGYDYKKNFWDSVDRRYEDACERQTIRYLIRKRGYSFDTILDAGCGFGRLFSCYKTFGKNFILLDFASNLLDQAKKDIGTQNMQYVQGSMLDIPLSDAVTNLVISIRTLHHIQEPQLFFKEAYRVLRPEGIFLFEIPNQRHFLNILRFLTGKLSHNPFSTQPLQLGQAYYNFNPVSIYTLLKEAGFEIQETRALSFFRSRLLKKIFPFTFLSKLDAIFQALFSSTFLTPSILVMCRKTTPK